MKQPPKIKTTNYINNADFLKSLSEYKKKCEDNKAAGLEPPQIPNYIGDCFMKISEGVSHNFRFIGYTYRDEMVSDGIENCLMYFANFDPEKSSNPFGYFTQIIWYAFIRRIKKEKTQQYVKYKATEQFGILDENELMEMEDGTTSKFEMYDNLSEFIEKFETSISEAKTKKKLAKKPKFVALFDEEV
jgi:hypothetical protein